MSTSVPMRLAVILPAAGAGRRMVRWTDSQPALDPPSSFSKVELALCGMPVFAHALRRFLAFREVIQAIVAVTPGDEAAFIQRHAAWLADPRVQVVGGSSIERWATVQAALAAVSTAATHIAVHDAARPLVPSTVIRAVFDAIATHPAVIPVVPVTDTLRRLDDPHQPLGAVVPRQGLVGIQTPQAFEAATLRRAYAVAADLPAAERQTITDDGMLVEWLGVPLKAVPGHPANLKLTRPEDLGLLAAWASATGD